MTNKEGICVTMKYLLYSIIKVHIVSESCIFLWCVSELLTYCWFYTSQGA